MTSGDLRAVVAHLRRGGRVELLQHPSTMGFRRTRGGENHGQVADWVRAMPDGSRLHVHEMRGGRFVLHRDRWDPDRGLPHAVAHVLLETRAGNVAVLGGILRLAGVL